MPPEAAQENQTDTTNKAPNNPGNETVGKVPELLEREKAAAKLYDKKPDEGEPATPEGEGTKEADEAKAKEAEDLKAKELEEQKAKEAEEAKKKESEGKGTKKEDTKVPEKYELKLPEDSLLGQGDIEEIASFSKGQGFSQEQAQAVLERGNLMIASFAEGQKEKLAKQTVQWLEDTKLDKELGGENVEESVEISHRVIKRFGSESLRAALSATGLGNHPELIRMCKRIGKTMTEDQFILGGSPPEEKKTMVQHFYGDSLKKEDSA